jgi:glutaredoxin
MEIILYSLPVCPKCDEVKVIFKENKIEYKEKNLEDEDVFSELLLDCVTLTEAPIIRIDGMYSYCSEEVVQGVVDGFHSST